MRLRLLCGDISVVRQKLEAFNLQMERIGGRCYNGTIFRASNSHRIPRGLPFPILWLGRHASLSATVNCTHRNYQPTVPSRTSRSDHCPRLQLDISHTVHSKGAPQRSAHEKAVSEETTQEDKEETLQVGKKFLYKSKQEVTKGYSGFEDLLSPNKCSRSQNPRCLADDATDLFRKSRNKKRRNNSLDFSCFISDSVSHGLSQSYL